MVKTTFGLLGKGSAPALAELELDPLHMPAGCELKKCQQLNMLGNTWTTRFLSFVAHKNVYTDVPDNLKTMLAIYAADLHSCVTEELPITDGDKVSACYLGECGDWAYNVKAFCLKRSWLNMPKMASSKKPCGGICRRCLAGCEIEPNVVPWEDFSAAPAWLLTLGSELPWDEHPPLIQGPHDPTSPESFACDDFWHNMHLGVGKTWVANVVVYALDYVDGSSVEARFETISTDHRIWGERTGTSLYTKSIKPALVGHGNESPDGCWNKGEATTQLMQWLEDFTGRLFSHRASAEAPAAAEQNWIVP
jgi:hypothetical protein